jgi:hypothetical protein
LKSVTFPDSLEYIDTGAFRGCTDLTDLFISESVKTIKVAFSGCANLKHIVVAENNPVYDSRENCNAIIKTEDNTLLIGGCDTVIPASVSIIGRDAFTGRTGLTNIQIPDTIKVIKFNAFLDCTGLKSVTIPASVEEIGNNAFPESTEIIRK